VFIPYIGNTNRIKPTFGVGVIDQIKIINNFMANDTLIRPGKGRQTDKTNTSVLRSSSL
jgi:hypothetical protein